MQKIFKERRRFANKSGFTAIVGVLVIGTTGIAIVSVMFLTSVSSMKTSLVIEDSVEARALADTCAEEALQKLLADTAYAGSETLTLGSQTCTIRPVLGSGNTNREIETFATVDGVTRRVEVVIATVQPMIVLTSWQEVVGF